jgi:hypothetical protein
VQCPIALGGAALFRGDVVVVVVDGALLDVDVDVDVDVDEGMVVVLVVVTVVVVTGAVVVVGAPELDVITNPQPRAGSFNIKELEIGTCVGVVVVERGAVVVVVVVTLVDVDVVVGSEAEVDVDVGGEFFVTSRPTPVNTRPSSATRRTNRNGHRRAEGVFRDAGTLRHGNSQKP